MNTHHYKIITTSGSEPIFTLEEAAELTGMHAEMILEFVRGDLVHIRLDDDAPREAPRFDEAALVRLRHIENLRREHVNLRTVRYILHLLDRLEAAHQELRALRERMR